MSMNDTLVKQNPEGYLLFSDDDEHQKKIEPHEENGKLVMI